VKVKDVEDQPPEFIVVTPVARVSEDAPPGTSIIQGFINIIFFLFFFMLNVLKYLV